MIEPVKNFFHSSKSEPAKLLTLKFGHKSQQPNKRIVPLSYQIAGLGLNLISVFNNEWAAEKLSQLWFTVFKRRPKHWVDKFWRQADFCIEINLTDKTIPVSVWGKGPLVVLMHGWSGSGTQFRYFIPELVKAGFKVAVFDAPAHGRNPGKKAHVIDFADSLVQIQQQVGPVDTVIAHSLGAMAATLATHRGLTVNRLVLLAPQLDASDMFGSYATILNLNKKLAQRFKALAGQKMADILGLDDPWELLTIETLLQEKEMPGLIVFDSEDEEVSQQHIAEIESSWVNAESFKTQGLGHIHVLKDKEVIQRVIKFFKAGC